MVLHNNAFLRRSTRVGFYATDLPNLMSCASKLIKYVSVKFYVTCSMCCTSFFLPSLPSRPVTLSDLVYTIEYCPSVCRTSHIVLSERELTLVRPTQPVEIFRNVSSPFLSWPPTDIRGKFYGEYPRETPPSGDLNARGVVKYSDFGLIKGYISETVQDRR